MKNTTENTRRWQYRRLPCPCSQDGLSLIGICLALLVLAGLCMYVFVWLSPTENSPGTDGKPGTSALENLRTAAENGDAVAALRLGRLYADGLSVEQDWPEAARWYRKAAQGGNWEGAFQLGLLFERGTGVSQDWKEAAKWYRTAAEHSHADAEWRLGLCFRDGTGVDQDPVWAKIWLEKAANQGQEEAKDALEELSSSGQEALDPVVADKNAAEAGDATAQYRMGGRCLEGVGVGKDEVAAVEWFRKASAQGHAGAQYRLGDCLWSGIGIDKDRRAALEWYRQSAEQGYSAGQRALGKCQMAAGDREGSTRWLMLAADGGDAEGQYLLALCYQKGLGIAQDAGLAKKWLRESAKNGYAKAQAAIGALEEIGAGEAGELLAKARRGDARAQYQLGIRMIRAGKEKDGMAWIESSARRGCADAAIWLGNHYHGIDLRQSFYWWSLAADCGSPQAQWHMVELCRSGRGTSASDTEALRWAKKAAENGDRQAMYYVAECFEQGRGCTKNDSEAKKWYSRAGAQYDVERLESQSMSKGSGTIRRSGLTRYRDERGQRHVRGGKRR